jgi:hypothetical protein
VINYPHLSGDEIFTAVEKFYKSYYLRPHYIFKSLKKMARDPDERKRMWAEGKQFFHTMRKRREMVAKPQITSSTTAA